MSSQPLLQKLPTIRSKLGSVIVFAVAVTILISYVIIGFALKNTPMDSETVEVLALARSAALGELDRIPARTAVVHREPDGTITIEGSDLGLLPPAFDDGVPHWGIVNQTVYATVPTDDGGWVAVLQPSRSRGSLGRISSTLGFLQTVWPRFVLAGLVAAAIALVAARWLARGMTQPLRDMAAAARRMERGDYTTRVHVTTHDEVGQLAVAFNRMSEELENLERTRRDLVANVSHELKTPIAAIRAHLENLLDGVERPDPRTLEVMLVQTERLGRLVEQLLDLSRLESGEMPLERRSVDVDDVVSRVISEISVSRHAGDLTINREIPEDLPPLDADPERLHQVLFNLVDNAVRFTPPGGEVTIGAERRDGRVEVRVSDTGVGIAPEHLPRLFERFYRVDPSRSRDDGGTGIGLAIARSVVEAHGGHIRAASEPGRGSTFTFDLPVATAVSRRDP
ncbi:MAG TPA: ATP-binding protein [Actinomycetota bacterium]